MLLVSKKNYLDLINSLQNLEELVQDDAVKVMIRKEAEGHKLDSHIPSKLCTGKSYPANEFQMSKNIYEVA